MPPITPGARDALIIVDVQNDFLPGGALAVPEGDAVIAPLTRLSHMGFGCVIATQDWHPEDHMSFSAQGGPWPVHCVGGAPGADFPPTLDQRPISLILRKGCTRDRDSYSAFADNDGAATTGLAGWLRERAIERVVIGGLALDFCVAATARDARKAGFETIVLADASRPVVSSAEEALNGLRQKGVAILTSDQISA